MEMETMIETTPNPDISRCAGKLPVGDLPNEFDTKLSLEKPEYGAPSSAADVRSFSKAMGCRVELDLSEDHVRQRVMEDILFWFPPGTRISNDSHDSPAAEIDPYLASLGFDEDDEPVLIAQVDRRALAKARRNNRERDELFFRQSEKMRVRSHNYARAALSYLRRKGHKLKLVKACLYEAEDIPDASRVHFNFKAKGADCPHAPPETYFVQLLDYGDSKYTFERCISLGKSESLPYIRYNRGCRICTANVHHPPKRDCKDGIW